MGSYAIVLSPMGPLTLMEEHGALSKAMFGEALQQYPRDEPRSTAPVVDMAQEQLAEYFNGTRQVFDLPLSPEGTEFQLAVWNNLKTIPYGLTVSYGDIARRLGDRNASRAVGLANGRNPLAIIVPCHRVVGANGKLTGYSGGIERKIALLEFEASVLANGPRIFSLP